MLGNAAMKALLGFFVVVFVPSRVGQLLSQVGDELMRVVAAKGCVVTGLQRGKSTGLALFAEADEDVSCCLVGAADAF